ncbi:MAG: class II fumarate hydratase [Sedimenticola sp.]
MKKAPLFASSSPPSGVEGVLYGEQTLLALDNFKISGLRFPGIFIHTLGLIKACAAKVNGALGLLPGDMAQAIEGAACEVAEGLWDEQFPVDVFQTGSGTSTNMNANEVIAELAGRRLGYRVHPNDHVNLGQSSNDVIPTAIHVSAVLELQRLKQSLHSLQQAITERAEQFSKTVKTGRTHLMDAVPITIGQELSGWASQIEMDGDRLVDVEQRLLRLAQGGTAIGTGLNTHAEFAQRFSSTLVSRTGLHFQPTQNSFAAISAQDTAVELSGQLRVTAITLLKIVTDMRWMNSGPTAGLGEIKLPELQPGSSIMPGKVNPVSLEAVGMACAQVIGLDTAIATAAQDNRFQLATMLPLLAFDLLQQLSLLTAASAALEEQAISCFEVAPVSLGQHVKHNVMLVTALTPRIGYELAGKIARTALEQGREVIDVAYELSGLHEEELHQLLDPLRMARPHDELTS